MGIFLFRINYSQAPFLPNNWKAVWHQRRLIYNLYSTKLKLFRFASQIEGRCPTGHELRKECKGHPVLNANALDYLLANQHLIPDDWKSEVAGMRVTPDIIFWGTIYENAEGDQYVRALTWHDGKWQWNAHWLNSEFCENRLTVLQTGSIINNVVTWLFSRIPGAKLFFRF